MVNIRSGWGPEEKLCLVWKGSARAVMKKATEKAAKRVKERATRKHRSTGEESADWLDEMREMSDGKSDGKVRVKQSDCLS